MSKIGNKPIKVPKKTVVNIANNIVSVSGPKGVLKLIPKHVDIQLKDDQVIVESLHITNKKYKKYHGLYRSLINNMIQGVTQGFEKVLILDGVGYRVNLESNKLAFSIGFSNVIYKNVPPGISVNVTNNNKNITITGIDKNLVGLFSAQIRSLRPPESYIGKGIRYSNEIIVTKQGKSNSK